MCEFKLIHKKKRGKKYANGKGERDWNKFAPCQGVSRERKKILDDDAGCSYEIICDAVEW